ncbi:MAG: PilX N-terminal domain-containing pilus assembly protein [candidate division Zixibacteria bacterium]|nr:PilX N-terminal domain-containing pilus assembly protein [candidate division Zixibacteria bacterium]
MKPILIKSQRGFATLIALIMVVMLTLLGLAALEQSDDEMTIAGNELQEMRTFYAAESGMETATALLQAEYDSTGIPPTTLPSDQMTINGCYTTFTTADDGVPTPQILTNGTLVGLHASVKSFTINATAINTAKRSKVDLSQSFEAALVPIFQFAVFYGNDLEIAPGPSMTLLGRVHSNGNMYIQSGNSLYMDSYVTASGDIIHGRSPAYGGSVANGDIFIKDASGAYVNMDLGGSSWLDANHSDWYDSSIAKWQGRVQDASHGQEELNVPLSTGAGGDAHKLIEPASGGNVDSYESLATLKFIDGQAYQLTGGVWNDVTASMIADSVISFKTGNDRFYDGREGTKVDVMDLDIEEMYDDGWAPSNGVVYFSDRDVSKPFPALRLVDGDELDAGLTIASENPIYIWGDYNTIDKKPAAVMGDACTFLSNDWDDANQLVANLNSADETTMNVSYLTGNVVSAGGNYSGGFENLPRFLESWSGEEFIWTGSAVNLWESTQATGQWSYGSFYTAPIRTWSYDTDLDDPANHPPETPCVRVFQRTGWKQEYVGYDL